MLYEHLSNRCTLFAGISPDEIRRMLDMHGCAIRTYPAHSFPAMQGDRCRSLFILCEGRINATMINKEGRQVIIEQFADWSVLAPAFVFATENAFPVNVETTTDCTMLVLGKDTLLKMLHANAVMMENYMREISDKCAALTVRVKEFALTTLRDRLLAYLNTRTHYGKQQEIADRFGVARPSLNRTLQELSAEGIIKMEHGKIVLLKRAIKS